MSDCPNAEMRDRLPDLLHEQLDASAQAAVASHVSGCADCRAELALLRRLRVSLSSGIVAIDTAAIARTVVARTTMPHAVARRRRWSDWRLAAAAAVVAVSAASLVLAYGRHGPPNEAVASRVASSAPAVDSGAQAQRAASDSSRVARKIEANVPRAELAAAGDVSDLSESDLRTLLGDLDTIEAVPSTEPEPVSMRVTLPESGGGY